MEIMVIMVIIGILGTLAIPAYFRSMEMTYDNQAKANLKAMASAEKTYYIDMNAYFYDDVVEQPGTILEINAAFGLALPAGADRKWDYGTNDIGCVEAVRIGDDGRAWRIMDIRNETEPTTGTCEDG